MRATSRLIRTVLVAAGLLAISASAAQAMPTRQSSDTSPQAMATVPANAPEHDPLGAAKAVQAVHTSSFVLGHQLTFVPAQPMTAAVDSPTDQTAPLVINQPVPVVTTVSASSGFGWTDAGIGAAVAALLLILAGFAATRVRPRQTATL